MGTAAYTISDYLMDRLAELGVDRVFGVPGDFTLGLLDHVVAHRDLTWTGCANELNAGYAADGYARMRGLGALMTTFGVGELSAINAVAGSYAEHVPVVHIVGSPTTAAQSARRMVHHSLGDGDFGRFARMHEQITCASAELAAASATTEIDRVLTAVRDGSRPGYLLLPADVGEAPADPPAGPLPAPRSITDPAALAGFAEAATRLLDSAGTAGNVAVLAGVLVHRFGAAQQLADLLAASPLPHATTLWGKSVVDESSPLYLGVYAGAASAPQVASALEGAGAVIAAGVQFTDLNSGFFTDALPRERTIELSPDAARVGAAAFGPLAIGDALGELARLARTRLVVDPRAPLARSGSPEAAVRREPSPAGTQGEAPLSQELLWSAVAAHLRPGDIVLADQGTSFYGMAMHRLPGGVTFLGQPLWASIGYTLPALLGASLASPGRRAVLLIGDGAAQTTVQELSTVLRLDLAVTVVVVDNDGYTVERAIHGADEPYNDIARWDWTALPAAFAPGGNGAAHRAATAQQLAAALEAAAAATGLSLIQAVVPRMDVPDLLTTLARAASAANSARAAASG